MYMYVYVCVCVCVCVCASFLWRYVLHLTITLSSLSNPFPSPFPSPVSLSVTLQVLDARKTQLISDAREICQQRIKELEQQQSDLALKSIMVEEALKQGERVCAADLSRAPLACAVPVMVDV